MINTYDDLRSEITKNDFKFRTTARSMCRSKSLGDDLYHSSILKILELSLLGLTINDLQKLLYSTMITTRLDMLRNFNNSKTQSLQADILGDILAVEDDYVCNKNLLNTSLHFVNQLKNDEDRLVFLNYINGMKIKNISKIYNIGANSIKSKIRRIRVALKNYLENGN